MARRTLGDLYEIALDGDKSAFLQQIGRDRAQLGSQVVQVFTIRLPRGQKRDLRSIASDRVAFYSHVFLRAGETLAAWRKIGNVAIVQPMPTIWWFTPPIEMLQAPTCNEWNLWSTDSPWQRVPSSDKRLDRAEYGKVMSPISVKGRAQNGVWPLRWPERA